MQPKRVWAGIGLVALLFGIVAHHGYTIVRTKRALISEDPSFVRITRTTNTYTDCGWFVSAQNRAAFPGGERFYWIGARVYSERQIQAAERAGDPIQGDPHCSAINKGGWVSAIFDPLLLPILGTAN